MAISNPTDIGSTFVAASASSVALTTAALVPAGAKIFLVITWFNNPTAATISSISDGTNTYTVDKTQLATNVNAQNSVAVASADAPAGLASSSTITVNFSLGSNDRGIMAMYSTGVKSGVAAAYGAVGQGQTGTAWSSTTTTVTSGDILVGGSHWEDSTPASNTPSGGNTEVHDINAGGGSAGTSCYQLGTGAAIAASGTWSLTSATSGLASAAVAYSAAIFAGNPVHASLPFRGPGRNL